MIKNTPYNIYSCTLCKSEAEFENIRYSNDGKRLICKGCYNQLSKGPKEDKNIKENIKGAKMKKNNIKQKPEKAVATAVRVICSHCKYKFALKPGARAVCPYCNKEELKRYEELTAERLLNEVSAL